MSSSGRRAEHQRIRFGCTICASIRMLKSVMRLSCDRCGCARSRTRLNGLGSGSLPLRRIRLTRNTKSAPLGRFRYLLRSGPSEQLGLVSRKPNFRLMLEKIVPNLVQLGDCRLERGDKEPFALTSHE